MLQSILKVWLNLAYKKVVCSALVSELSFYIASLYSKVRGIALDELRYKLFAEKSLRNEMLPPTTHSFQLHLKRANFQSWIWRSALNPLIDPPPPEDHGWSLIDGTLKPVLCTQEPVPKSIKELTTCRCMRKEGNWSSRTCSCSRAGLVCTDACICNKEYCKNSEELEVDGE